MNLFFSYMPVRLECPFVLLSASNPVARLTLYFVDWQMAKDVTTFLAWAAEPEHDERKLVSDRILVGMHVG
jgi:hypothetical protein